MEVVKFNADKPVDREKVGFPLYLEQIERLSEILPMTPPQSMNPARDALNRGKFSANVHTRSRSPRIRFREL